MATTINVITFIMRTYVRENHLWVASFAGRLWLILVEV